MKPFSGNCFKEPCTGEITSKSVKNFYHGASYSTLKRARKLMERDQDYKEVGHLLGY